MKRVFHIDVMAVATVALIMVLTGACGDDSTGDKNCPEGTVKADDGSCVPIMADGDDTDTDESDIIEQEVTDGDAEKDLEDTVDEDGDIADPDSDPDPDPECATEACATEGYQCSGDHLQQCQTQTLENSCFECSCTDTAVCDYGCTDAGSGIAYCNDAPVDGDIEPDVEEEMECAEVYEDLRECRGDELWECSSVNPPPCGSCYLVRTCEADKCIDVNQGTAYCDTPIDGDETDVDESEVCDTCSGSGECTVQGYVCNGDNLNHCSTETIGPAQCACYNCNCTLSSTCQYGCTDPGSGLATCNEAPADGDDTDTADEDVDQGPCVCIDDTDCNASYYCDGCYCQLRQTGDEDDVDAVEFISCSSDPDCPTGYYCGGLGYCTQDCIDNTDCPEGFECTDRGYCSQPSDLDFEVIDVVDNDTDGSGCTVHSDCPEYMYCKFSLSECRIGSRCTDPADCAGNPSGENCVDGTCTQ